MNFPIAVLLLCALIGLADKMIGGRFGLAEEFDRGMTRMGSLTVTMSGVYCFSVRSQPSTGPNHFGQQRACY